tara:strand:+ start:407 stop:601 length:195 start_codon:yes stop_codon:yes gene_type:complete
MFEVIGFLVAWLMGGVVLFYATICTSGWWANTGNEIGDTIIGFWAGIALLVIYMIATVVYLAAT